MKIRLIFFLSLIFTSIAYGQFNAFKINGEVKNPEENKYVYLCLFDAKNDSIWLKKPLVDGRFIFDSGVNLEGYLSRSGKIFLTKDTLHTTREIYYSTNFRMLMIDSLFIEIQDQQNLKYAKISGSLLNREFDEMLKSLDNKEFSKFFSSHQNSVISIKLLNIIIALDHMLAIGNDEHRRFFLSLTERIRQSKEGKKVAEKLLL